MQINNTVTGGGQNNADIHQWLFWQQLDRANLRAEEDAKAKSVVTEIGKIVGDYFTARTQINGDGELSAQGRENRLVGLSKRSLEALDALTGPILKALDARAVEAEMALRRAANGAADDHIRALLKAEARTAAKDIDPLILQTRYLQLCEDGGDDLSCQALEEAGAFVGNRLPPDVAERGRLLRAARLLPDRHEELRQVGEMRSIIGAAAAQARRELALSFATMDEIEKAAMGSSFNPDAQ